ncbi:MAG: FAD-dependent oxidoreductase [Anaerococcus sp.]
MKIVVIGGVAAGATFATNLRRLSEEVEIVMFEKGRDVSFKNCEIPYYLSGYIDDSKKLIARDIEVFKEQDNIDARNYHEVIEINKDEKFVIVKNLKTNEEFKENYDKLIIATGAYPNIPRGVKGVDKENVFVVKDVVDVENIREYVEKNNVKDLTILGPGFIGLESMENLRHLGLNINLLIRSRVLSSNIDEELSGFIEENIVENGVNIVRGKDISEIHDDKVILDDNSELKSQAVILAIGMHPVSDLAQKAGLEIDQKTKAIITDDDFKTSNQDIYAIGDVTLVENFISHKKQKLALAWPAHRQAKYVANHIMGNKQKKESYIGAFVLRCFDYNIAVTGLTEKVLDGLDIEFDSTLISHTDKVSIMKNVNLMYMKILFEKKTGRILGAQAIGRGNVDKRIDVVSAMIKLKATIYDLRDSELAYQPLFSNTFDGVNILANQACDIKENELKQVRLRNLENVLDDFEIYDLRSKEIFEKRHLKNAKNLPFSNIRENYDNLDKNKKILLYDRSGQRSIKAIKMLKNKGFDKVYFLEGAWIFLEKYNKLMNLNLLSK